ncbi:MAG: glycine cleavage system protein GcvH [Desulfofustis sp.]|jgi:glycine cleavage system H protein|nr:glycine cleavage system protein GcvH [Desulfofustis sp.]
MKEIKDLNLPDEIRYSKDHEWAKVDGDIVRVGISDYAQDALGDIVFVELPEVGAVFKAGEEFGTLESVKAVSELYLPVGGEIVAVNMELEDSPELINDNPYTGWIIEVKPGDIGEFDQLLDRHAYLELLKAE